MNRPPLILTSLTILALTGCQNTSPSPPPPALQAAARTSPGMGSESAAVVGPAIGVESAAPTEGTQTARIAHQRLILEKDLECVLGRFNWLYGRMPRSLAELKSSKLLLFGLVSTDGEVMEYVEGPSLTAPRSQVVHLQFTEREVMFEIVDLAERMAGEVIFEEVRRKRGMRPNWRSETAEAMTVLTTSKDPREVAVARAATYRLQIEFRLLTHLMLHGRLPEDAVELADNLRSAWNVPLLSSGDEPVHVLVSVNREEGLVEWNIQPCPDTAPNPFYRRFRSSASGGASQELLEARDVPIGTVFEPLIDLRASASESTVSQVEPMRSGPAN